MKYKIEGTFETNRPMTEKEHEDVHNTLRLQLDEPWVEQEDGQWDDSEFEISGIELTMEPNDVVWRSTLTEEMVKHLSEEQRSRLTKYLDDAVVACCSEFEVEG